MRWLLILALSIATVGCQSTPEWSASHAESIVKVKSARGLSTGFFVGRQMYVTAYHSVSMFGCPLAEGITVNGYEAHIIAFNTTFDIAILKCPNLWQRNPLTISLKPPKILDTTYAVGRHHGQQFALTRGHVAAFNRFQEIISTSAVNPGCSGGPLLDKDFKVIGVNVRIITRGNGWQGLSIHTRIEEVVKLLNEL